MVAASSLTRAAPRPATRWSSIRSAPSATAAASARSSGATASSAHGIRRSRSCKPSWTSSPARSSNIHPANTERPPRCGEGAYLYHWCACTGALLLRRAIAGLLHDPHADVQPPERHQVAVFQGVGPADTKRQAVDVRAVRAAQVHHKELVAAGAQHDMPPAYAVIVAAPGADVHVEPVVRLAVRANHHIPPDLQRHGPARHADGGEDHAPVPATGALLIAVGAAGRRRHDLKLLLWLAPGPLCQAEEGVVVDIPVEVSCVLRLHRTPRSLSQGAVCAPVERTAPVLTKYNPCARAAHSRIAPYLPLERHTKRREAHSR